MTPLNIAPLFLLLGLMTGTVLIAYLAAGAYFRWKENRFWSNANDVANEPVTDEERAAMELWNLPEGSLVEFEDPEGDPGAETAPSDIAKDVAEMKAVQAQRERFQSQQTIDYNRIPTGEVFTDLNGRRYKFVANPAYEALAPAGGHFSNPRVKISVGGAVGNPNAIPTPSGPELEAITRRQAVESVESRYGTELNVDPEAQTCELCGVSTDHNHSGGEVRRFIIERAEAAFKTYVANIDLTRLPAEDVEKLWARCKLRIETDASLAAMIEMDRYFSGARKLAQEATEDEEYYRQVCKEPKEVKLDPPPAPAVLDAADMKTCGFEVPSFAPCTRAFGHEGPCALPKYAKYCGNCEDLFPELRSVENCGCGMDLETRTDIPNEYAPGAPGADEEEGEEPVQPKPIEMPKRFMSAVTRQIAEEEVFNGLNTFGDELAEEIVEEDQKRFGKIGAAALVEKLVNDESVEDFVDVYSRLSHSELETRVEALLRVAQKRVVADKERKVMAEAKRDAKKLKKPAKKSRKK